MPYILKLVSFITLIGVILIFRVINMLVNIAIDIFDKTKTTKQKTNKSIKHILAENEKRTLSTYISKVHCIYII